MGGSEHRGPERCSGCEMVARWFLQVTNTNFFLFFFMCVFMCVFFLPSPFYGEDFYCEIPRTFRHLSFYIFDRDVFRRDSIIGMCS